MSGFKFLLDTNVIIGLEDPCPVDSTLTELVRRCSQYGVRLFIDSAVDDDIRRDRDLERRAATLSKIEKFERLHSLPKLSDSELSRHYGQINSANDRSDCRLLYCLDRGAADFLITADDRLLRRAQRFGLGERVLSAQDAVQWLRQTFQPTEVKLPYVIEKFAYSVDTSNALFDGLRADYPGFDRWFREKCARQHRKCWVVDVSGELAGVLVRKDENRSEADGIKLTGEKILKISTFKISEDFRGEKFGEQLLKQCLWYAQLNGYELVYVTAYADKEDLIHLLTNYGFSITGRNFKGEIVLEKSLYYDEIFASADANFIDLDRKFYPRFYDGVYVSKYIVPIRGNYHRKLFPEVFYRKPLPLFDGFPSEVIPLAPRVKSRIPGNTIKKVYVCRAQSKRMKAGDILLFYLSKDDDTDISQCITSAAIVEGVNESRSIQELVRLTAKRSVFSRDELESIQIEREAPVKVIDFILVGHAVNPIDINTLVLDGILKGPPQSITKLPHDKYLKLCERLDLGYPM
jgi:ribosomal protein S18 acetylase RimI-like enzyme